MRCILYPHETSVRNLSREPLTVMDRETPVARLVPYDAGSDVLVVRRPAPDAPTLQEVPLPPPIRLRSDAVRLLLEERGAGP